MGGLFALSTEGSTHASFPFFVDSTNLLVSGIIAPQAGLGHLTVRAHIHAMTVASLPSESLAFG